MILSFSEEIFADKILSGNKLYTLRTSNRIKTGTKLQLWLHNPRNVSKKPRQFAIAECESVDEIEIDFQLNVVKVIPPKQKCYYMAGSSLIWFSLNDGFDSWDHLKRFFVEKQKHDTNIPLKLNRIWFTNVSPV